MILWYEWFLFILLFLFIIFAAVIIYQAAIGSSNLYAPFTNTSTQPSTNTGLNPAANPSCGLTGFYCDPLLGLACIDNSCQCVQTGYTLCTGFGCVNTQNNPFACGSCGISCLPGEVCCQGVCKSSSSIESCGACGISCPGIQPKCCQNSCVDLDNDVKNCGECLQSCSLGQFCCGGVCATPSSQNCEGCGIPCPPNTICQDSKCVPGCESGFILCPTTGVCTNLQQDNFNCSACEVPCPVGSFCQGGKCQSNTCDSGLVFCPLTNGCIEVSTNSNCGQCENLCPLYCTGQPVGACVCNTSFDCPGAMTCVFSEVQSLSICVAPACPVGTVFCNSSSSCETLSSSATACGACGTVCSSGVCLGGLCTCEVTTDCPLGRDCVSGLCVFH